MTATASLHPVTVLVVCTGNICRSPLAAQLLIARLDHLDPSRRGQITVTSAGTRVNPTLTMPPELVEQSLRYGGDPSGHLPTQLDRDLIAAADLILTATRSHRGDVVRLLPRAARRTFTLPQFVRLAADAPAAPDALALIDTIAANRGITPPPADPVDDDIEDPYRRAPEIAVRVAGRIERLIDVVADRLAENGAAR